MLLWPPKTPSPYPYWPMLWNCDFLYVALPRTASKSLNIYFSQVWQPPVFGRVSAGHLKAIAQLDRPSPFITEGRGTENLRQALDMTERSGRFLRQFKAVIFVLRNPYDMALSSYRFLRTHYAKNMENPRFQLAHESDFDTFCARFQPPDFKNWLTDAMGQRAPNLRLMRLESLADDMRLFNEEFGIISDMPLPHANAAPLLDGADDAQIEVTSIAEAHIYDKYRLLFDLGGYGRRALREKAEHE